MQIDNRELLKTMNIFPPTNNVHFVTRLFSSLHHSPPKHVDKKIKSKCECSESHDNRSMYKKLVFFIQQTW